MNNGSVTSNKAGSKTRALRLELKTQKALLGELVECVPSGVIVLDKGGNVVQLNRNATSMFDIRSRDCLGRHYSAVVSENVAEVFEKALAEVADNGFVINMPLWHRMDMAIELNLGLNATLFKVNDESFVIFVCHDRTSVTELDRLRTLDLQKTESVSRVAHELKNPLSAIKAYCEVLVEMYDEGDPESGFVKGIDEEADHLLTLLSELMNVSTIEAGQLKPDFDEVDLVDVVRNTLISMDMANKGHRLVLRSEKDIPFIIADPIMIKEIITNLVSNAIRYSPDGGDVTMEISREGKNVRVDVIDRGIGISEEHLENIFEKFYRVYIPGHGDIPGSGLGLPIVKGLVEAHKGSITVKSTQGKGSTFSVLLPISRAFDIIRQQSASERQPFA